MNAPSGYRELPELLRCQCVKEWTDKSGKFWCCGQHKYQTHEFDERFISAWDQGRNLANDARGFELIIEHKDGIATITHPMADGSAWRPIVKCAPQLNCFDDTKMTHHEFRKALDALQMTQEGFAEWLGISLRSAQRYAAGDPIPASVAKLVRLMVRLKLKPDDVP